MPCRGHFAVGEEQRISSLATRGKDKEINGGDEPIQVGRFRLPQ